MNGDEERDETHPFHEVAKIFATAVARSMTPAELERIAQALEKLDPEDLEQGDGMPSDVLGIIQRERATR